MLVFSSVSHMNLGKLHFNLGILLMFLKSNVIKLLLNLPLICARDALRGWLFWLGPLVRLSTVQVSYRGM